MIFIACVFLGVVHDLAHFTAGNVADAFANADGVVENVLASTQHCGDGAECIAIPFGQEDRAQVTAQKIFA